VSDAAHVGHRHVHLPPESPPCARRTFQQRYQLPFRKFWRLAILRVSCRLIPTHDGVRRPKPTVTDRRPTLVVVEDDDHVRRALTRWLCSRGYGVRAFDSAEAWLAGICPADGAIIDINLPGMSGLELDERLRREGRAIPIVFITAHDEPGPAASRVVLQKPLEAQALLNAIELALAARDGGRVAGEPS
jgi:CheY-like chemotaxis protein